MRTLWPGFLFLLFYATACGGGGGGGSSEPAATPNDAPAMQVPSVLAGGPVRYSFTLPTTGSTALTFTATDADGDALLWQVGVPGLSQIAAGLVFQSPSLGATFTLELQPVTAPAAVELSLLVEDTRGAAAAIDLLIVRSGAPSITAVVPDSAFRTAPQQVTIQGGSFALGGAIATSASFAGQVAGNIAVRDENTLTCTTPSPALLGPNAVAVGNAFGSAALPSGAFTMYEYPVNLLDNDVALDGGAGGDLVVAGDGANAHVVYVEGSMLMHRASTDFGATFSPAQVLSGGEVPNNAQVVVVGERVTVAWGTAADAVLARSSTDGGATFAPAVTLGNGVQIERLQLVASGGRRYCGWVSGSLGSNPPRVFMTSSADDGATWRLPTGLQSGVINNQVNFAIGCDAEVAWVLALDLSAPIPGPYLARTTDGGVLWTAGVHRGPITADIGSPRICNDGARVFLVWMRPGGVLEYMVSVDRGATWPSQASALRPASLSPVGEPVVACEGERLFAAYRLGAPGIYDGIGFSRVGAAGAFPEHVTVSAVTEPVGVPSLSVRGNYALLAWRGGDVAGGAARVKLASSVDLGLTFGAPALFGDATAAQDEPRLLLDGARLWLGFLDYRGVTPALFANRTEQ